MSCLRLNLRSVSEDLETLSVFVEENALRAGMDKVQVNRILLVLEETTINIIRHAYGGQGGRLELCCTPVRGGLEISLVDEGPPFNPLEAAPAPDVVTDIASQILGLTDELSYRREEGQNVLTLGFLRKSGDAP